VDEATPGTSRKREEAETKQAELHPNKVQKSNESTSPLDGLIMFISRFHNSKW
jgi:hypothetical protein